jgi:spermidine synthase
MNNKNDIRLSLGVSLIALSTLMAEVLLIRVFEVIFLNNIGYAVITCAMFGFGLAGTYAAIWPVGNNGNVRKRLAILSLLFGVAILLLRPALNATTLIYDLLHSHKALAIALGGSIVYLLVLVPFFLSGLLLAYLFSAYSSRIRALYFWDLCGAALGCVIYIPFLRTIGPGGLMFAVAAVIVIAAWLLSGSRKWVVPAFLLAAGLLAIPFMKGHDYFAFLGHQDKRGVLTAQRAGLDEFSEWDPMSKIDVIKLSPTTKHVAYDGGSQSSHFFKFDGDFAGLRKRILEGTEDLKEGFWEPGVLASHYLKRDSSADVLIIGSAAGQETKAALLFNPGWVDGIELVGTVVRLGKQEYANFIGGIFNDPRVHNQVGEGRQWLRTSSRKYDIIQIHSNHTTSFITSGIGAISTVYLQTAEAYREYFSHLKDDGILHINHHFYPRLITTAALAWKQMGRSDFQRHVLVFERKNTTDTLATLLIKMSPWTEAEVAAVEHLFAVSDRSDPSHPNVKVIDPINPKASFLSADFFSGDFPQDLQARMDYRVSPTTDDRPYFDSVQMGFHNIKADPKRFTDESMASIINSRLKWPIGEYTVPAAIGFLGMMFALVLVLVPLKFSEAGRLRWPGRLSSMAYFGCLGFGFILIELMLIQLFMKLLGYPLLAYTTVIFAMLLSAGIGSMGAEWLGIEPAKRWFIPFLGIIVSGAILLMVRTPLFDLMLARSSGERILATLLMIFPLGFFMGMPFPLGILHLRKVPEGAIAWAWGINGLFTVLGGGIAGVISVFTGFNVVFLIAMGVYLTALLAFARARTRVASVVPRTIPEQPSGLAVTVQ